MKQTNRCCKSCTAIPGMSSLTVGDVGDEGEVATGGLGAGRRACPAPAAGR